jgi:hypothetical protein
LLGENWDSFRSPIRDKRRKDVSRTQDNAQRDEQQTDHGNNVNVRYIWRQKDQHSGRYNSGHKINQDGQNFNGSAKGRVGEKQTGLILQHYTSIRKV